MIKELEKERRKIRLKMHTKMDPNLKKLSTDLDSQKSYILDKSVSKILQLIGFDTEVYDPNIAGNVDVLAVDVRNQIICICENTTGKVKKEKIDKFVARKMKYEEEYKSLNGMKVYSVLICTNEEVFKDDLARKEAVLHGVSILTKNELENLIKNIKKGKISPSLFVEFIKKQIPRNRKFS